ncbi:hypothetical protein [Rossellomorea sp. NPDC077527]|uniref:hypothetical protein n=1 Tax=Rossellomorea sp. NPDC077527 TaxID=3364510 RepID=UPI0037CC972E
MVGEIYRPFMEKFEPLSGYIDRIFKISTVLSFYQPKTTTYRPFYKIRQFPFATQFPQKLPQETKIPSSTHLQTLPIVTIIKPYFFSRIPFTKGLHGLYNPVVQPFTENQKNLKEKGGCGDATKNIILLIDESRCISCFGECPFFLIA